MATKNVTIIGNFSGSANNMVRLDVYRANPDAYDFSKNYKGSFTEVFADLMAGDSYFVDFTGFTTGTFDLRISGDVQTPVTDQFINTDFKPGYVIDVTP